MFRALAVVVALAVVSFFGISGFAAEHPGEHPGAAVEHHEHPGTHVMEHPGEATEASAKQIHDGISEYIAKDTALKGGSFLLYDPQDKKVIQLNLLKVHDRVSVLKATNEYFACSDFETVTEPKAKYDLDFWMTKEGDKFHVNKISIHKLNDVPRYTYQDDQCVPVQ